MKKFILIYFICVSVTFSQTEDKNPKIERGHFLELTLGGVIKNELYSHWAKGGENTFGGKGEFALDHNYVGKYNFYENKIELAYGRKKFETIKLTRKTDDLIKYNLNYTYKPLNIFKYANYIYGTSRLEFESQFDKGYNYPDDTTIVSKFMSPGIIKAKLIGIEGRIPINKKEDVSKNYISLAIFPFSINATVVLDDSLSRKGAFGVDSSKNIKLSKGLEIDFIFKYLYEAEKTPFGLEIGTEFSAINNYDNKNKERFIEKFLTFIINCENVFAMWVKPFTKFNIVKDLKMKFVYKSNLIYDEDVPAPDFEEINGIRTQIGSGPRLQYYHGLEFGIEIPFKF